MRGTEQLNQESFTTRDEEENFKYVRILETDIIKQAEAKEK